MRLCHNLMSLNVYKNYTKALNSRSQAMENIESGSKLNSFNNFSTAFGRSEEFTMQIKGMQMAEKNLQDGFSMIQTIEGGLSSISESLVRMKQLTVQAANGSYNKADLESIQKEIDQLKSNISDITKNTNFNAVTLMDNKSVDPTVDAKHLGSVITGTIKSVSGANVGDIIDIPQYTISTKNLGINNGDLIQDGKSIEDINVCDLLKDKGTNISIVDNAIEQVNAIRSKYGAIEQRLNSACHNIGSSLIPLQKARSFLSDSNVAKEFMKFTKEDLLTQASNAMMVQSNNFPMDALRILENVR